jgi:hypothetical protein
MLLPGIKLRAADETLDIVEQLIGPRRVEVMNGIVIVMIGMVVMGMIAMIVPVPDIDEETVRVLVGFPPPPVGTPPPPAGVAGPCGRDELLGGLRPRLSGMSNERIGKNQNVERYVELAHTARRDESGEDTIPPNKLHSTKRGT